MPTTTTARTARARKKSKPVNSTAIAESALSAVYSDCHRHHAGSYIPERNLNFCCPVTVSLSQARRLMARYVSSYNEFMPKLLLALPPTCRVRLARESSVCIYVETDVVLDETKTGTKCGATSSSIAKCWEKCARTGCGGTKSRGMAAI